MAKRIGTKSDTVTVEATREAASEPSREWLSDQYEGQLSVDVFQQGNDVVIVSTIAGVRVEDLDIAIHNDMVTIRGVRQQPGDVPAEEYFYQECYWGGFSRSIILPVDVHAERAKATLKNGVLTIAIPKVQKTKVQVVKVKTDEE